SEAGALRGRLVGADGEMHRRLVEPFELQPCIARLTLARIAVERGLVRGGEVVADVSAARERLHQHEAPWLREADRRRVRSQRQQTRRQRGIDGVGAETPHVAPPAHELGKLRLEGGIEARWLGGHEESLSSKALASRRSAVAKPSVNFA